MRRHRRCSRRPSGTAAPCRRAAHAATQGVEWALRPPGVEGRHVGAGPEREAGRALLEKRRDALVRVRRAARPVHAPRVEPVRLHRMVGAEQPPHELARERHRHRRGVLRDLRAPARAPAGRSCVGRHHAAHEAALRAPPRPRTRGPVNTHSAARAMPTSRGRNHVLHASGTTPRRAKTKPMRADVGRDADVHRQRHGDAEAHRRPVDGGDHRLLHVEDAQRRRARRRRDARPAPRRAPRRAVEGLARRPRDRRPRRTRGPRPSRSPRARRRRHRPGRAPRSARRS